MVVLGACAGDEAPENETERAVAAPRFRRSPQLGRIASTVVPLAVDQTPMTVVAVLDGPSVASLQEAAARRLTRGEKGAVKAQRIAEQAAPRARIEAAGGMVIGSFQSALNGSRSGSRASRSLRCAGSRAWSTSCA